MSYITPNTLTGFTNQRLQIAEIVISGQPALNGYFTWHSLIDDNYDASPTIDSTDSTILRIDEGAYFGRATLAITRSGQFTYENYQFQFELNGSVVGQFGQTNFYNGFTADWAEADMRLETAGALKLKCIGVQNNAPSLLTGGINESRLYLWRSGL